jgi:thymidine kinase
MAKLTFHHAPMNAGKSSALLQMNENYRQRNMHTLLFVPHILCPSITGNTYLIRSRIGIQAEARIVRPDDNLFDFVEQETGVDCVFVDEAQFLSRAHVLQLRHVANLLDVPVRCYGLRSDFKAREFEGSSALFTLADEIVEVCTTICSCGSNAVMNMRVDTEGRRIMHGDQIQISNDAYKSVCSAHYWGTSLAPDHTNSFLE